MKKILCAVTFILSLFNIHAFATPALSSMQDPANQTPFYCPEQVDCVKKSLPYTCSYKTENPDNWDSVTPHMSAPMLPETLTLKLVGVISGFHSGNIEPVQCFYSVNCDQLDGQCKADLKAKKESNLEALYNPSTNWKFGPGDKAICDVRNSHDVKSCPLKQQSALSIYNLNISGGISVMVNNTSFKTVEMSQYAKMPYEYALAHCQDTNACYIDFVSEYGTRLGTVIVDADDHMKIVSINSERPGYAEIHRVGSLNAVEIGYMSR